MDLYRSGLNIADVYYTLARVLGNAGLILDTRPKNKPTLTSTGKACRGQMVKLINLFKIKLSLIRNYSNIK